MVAKAGMWIGRLVSVAALVAWCGWLAWSLSSFTNGPIGVGVLVLQFVAFAAALVVTGGLWVRGVDAGEGGPGGYSRSTRRSTPMPVMMADALGLDRSFVALADRSDVGEDDTGEIAWARRGLGLLGSPWSGRGVEVRMREAAWSVVSVDGLRRMAAVVALVVVLFSGRQPFERPSWVVVGLLVGGLVGLSLGHWLMSAGRIRPGARTIWSMASVGAGVGDGTSRSGLPIRWATTMATMVALNLAVALRGLSDRWTHGLGPMSHDARVAAMSVAIGLVASGLLGLRTLARPELGFYGATQRLEETSTRRLALGCTIAVAMLGFFVGLLPADGAS